MRWSDEWRMYVAAVLVFAAVALGADGAGRPVVVTAIAAAVAIAVVTLWRSAHTRQVLVVARRGTAAADLVGETLDRAGYRVCRCDGPTARPCPVDANWPCPIRRRLAGVAIVHDPASGIGPPRCGDALRVPATIVEPTPEGIARFTASLHD
jgi:hypothetical protein